MLQRILVPLFVLGLLIVTTVGAQLPPEMWLSVLESTEALTDGGEVAFVAQPGEWYRVTDIDGDWARVVRESDLPESAVWISLSARVELIESSAEAPAQALSDSSPPPTVTPSMTPTPVAVLATPSPTATLAPTLSPTASVDVTVVVAACATRVTAEAYLPALQSRLDTFSYYRVLEKQLSESASPENAAWPEQYRSLLRNVRMAAANLRLLCPPAQFEASHTQFSDSMRVFESAADDALAWLDLLERGLRAEDSGLIEQANGRLAQVSDKLSIGELLFAQAFGTFQSELTGGNTSGAPAPTQLTAPTSEGLPTPTSTPSTRVRQAG